MKRNNHHNHNHFAAEIKSVNSLGTTSNAINRARVRIRQEGDWYFSEHIYGIDRLCVDDLVTFCMQSGEESQEVGQESTYTAAASSTRDSARSPGFRQWRTLLDLINEVEPAIKSLAPADRLRSIVEFRDDFTIRKQSDWPLLEHVLQEHQWMEAKEPYYNVHPRIISDLCRCNLDKLPSSYLEVPGGFDTVDIRFSESSPDLTVKEGQYVQNILLAKPVVSRVEQHQLRSFVANGGRLAVLDGPCKYLSLYIDIGDWSSRRDIPSIRRWRINVRLREGKSLKEAFNEFEDSASEAYARDERCPLVVRNCLQLIATMGFLANSPDETLLEYDVLSKDRPMFRTADAEGRLRIIDRARRRGKHGWNVGTNELFLGSVPTWTSEKSERRRGEHTHAHIRGGHAHAVRCGKGKESIIIKWFRPTVVRPDLPFV